MTLRVNYLSISIFSRNIVRVYGLLLGADTFLISFFVGSFMNHAGYALWLLCACFLTELTAFPILVFGQTLPASQRLRLLQPNGAERLQSGSQYTIKWTGIDSARVVRLEYSTNNGASWKLITDKAVGGEYLWKPVPNEPSDSCLIIATGLAADSTESVGKSLVQFQVPRSSNNYTIGGYWGNESVGFSPDGTKILVTTFSQPLVNYSWRQFNLDVRDGKTGAVLYTLPPYIIDSVQFTRTSYWGYGYGWGSGWGGGGQGRWSPDGSLLLAQIADTVLGVYNAQTGALVRRIAVPTQGSATRCISMQWAAKGQEILATVQHRFFNPTSTNGYLDTVKTMMMRFNTNTGALSNTPFRISVGISTNAGCSGWWGYGVGAISNDGEKRYTYSNDSLLCVSGTPVIRSTRDNSLITTLPSLSGTYWNSWGWGGNNSLWSPNDSLIVQFANTSNDYSVYVINTQNGSIVQRFNNFSSNGYYGYYGGVQWSSDSRKILLRSEYGYGTIFTDRTPASLIADVQTGTVQAILRNMQNYGWGWGYGYGGWGGYGYGNTNASGSSTVTWSPDGRFVAGFLWQLRSKANSWDNLLNTVGIWDSQTGCLLQTFRLPFPDGLTDAQKRMFFNTPLQWSADGKRLLLFSPTQLSNRAQMGSRFVNGQIQMDSTFATTAYDGTALIASVNIDQIPCQEDKSDSVWTILPRGALRVANVNFPDVQCGTPPSSMTFPVANTTLRAITTAVPTITGANAADFSLVSIDGKTFDAATTLTFTTSNYQKQLEVRFTPSGFGDRVAQMTFTDTTGTELETITLTGRKDTLAVSPTDLRLSFSRVLQNSITSASVSFRNLSTLPLYWDGQMFSQTPPLQSGGQTGGQQFQSAAGSFRVDSIAPAMIAPGDSGRVYVTFLRTDKEGVSSDSSTVLRCGATTSQLLVTAEIVPNRPRMEVDSVLSFGHLICETSSGATLRVRNTGGKLLRIFNVGIVSDVFQTTAPRRGIEIQPFESFDIPLTFTPSVGGQTESAIVLNSDDLREPQRSIVLRGQKTLFQYEWSPALLDFGNVSFGMSRTKTVTLQNNSTEPYRWNTLPQALTEDFVVERVEPNPIPKGTSATVTVRFLGRREMVPVTAKLSLTMNDACKTTTLLNLAARVLEPQPHIVIADTVRLPALSCGTETRTPITISNSGDADLLINAFSIEGLHILDFPNDSVRLGATTLKPMGTTTLDFLFQPRDTGLRTATLLIKTNDTATARNGDIRVVLVGRKDSVGFVLNRQPRNLTTVDENTPLYDTLVVRNTGTVPLSWSNAQNPQEILPFRIDTTFRIERIEPLITQRNDSSRVIVRFIGGTAGLSALGRRFTLQGSSTLAPSCSRTSELALTGEVKKEPRLATIPDVSARLLCENTTTLTLRLANTGTDDVLIQPIDFLENPNAVFSSASQPSRIAARTGRDSIVITARTAQTGLFTAQVRIRSNAANMPDDTVQVTVRKDSSGLQAIPTNLDFAALAENVSAQSMITLVNTGTIEQRFVLPVRAGAFVLDSLGANPLPANVSAQARVRFAGSAGGVVRDTVRLADSCGRVLAVPLQARVVAGVASLPDSVAIQMGVKEEIPLYLRERRGVEAGMEVRFSVTLDNASLLDIVAPASESSVFSRRKDTISQTLTFRTTIPAGAETEPMVRLRLYSLLGNATSTTIQLKDVRIGGVAVRTNGVTQYRTLGINYASGSPRLLYAPNVKAFAVSPNPVGEELTLRAEVVKTSPLTVELTDILGRKQTLHEGVVNAGETALRLSASHVASGVYVLTVRVGTEQIARLISIIR